MEARVLNLDLFVSGSFGICRTRQFSNYLKAFSFQLALGFTACNRSASITCCAVFNQYYPLPTVTVLTTAELKTVYNVLYDVRYKWRYIGINLGIPVSDLKTIESEHHGNIGRCLEEVVSLWLRRPSLNPRWQTLIDALQAKSVDEVALAYKIKEKYIKLEPGEQEVTDLPVQEDESTHTPTSTGKGMGN